MLTGDRVSVLQDVQSSRMEGGDVRTTVRMDSMGMSCSLKDGEIWGGRVEGSPRF